MIDNIINGRNLKIREKLNIDLKEWRGSRIIKSADNRYLIEKDTAVSEKIMNISKVIKISSLLLNLMINLSLFILQYIKKSRLERQVNTLQLFLEGFIIQGT